jgi:hypothetical protein
MVYEEQDLANARDQKAETKVQVNFRLPVQMTRELKAAAKLLKLEAEAQDQESDHIDVSFVVRRALRTKLGEMFDRYGGPPKDDSDETWEKIRAAVEKHYSKR